ncbi:hypothetical protein [Arthrobacter sp. NEB 688]|uniref:hypothetical protein n=1 Tax=Arthrobacter sp. NEB 688 TaxID=904039 RepID=UPI001564FFE1|nr:hypothetical protein [Arthrobacter sp. NEB 688]QKE83827.1 hypothetical protein HL663_07670 [Arthrobacter sp. NEB 688]
MSAPTTPAEPVVGDRAEDVVTAPVVTEPVTHEPVEHVQALEDDTGHDGTEHDDTEHDGTGPDDAAQERRGRLSAGVATPLTLLVLALVAFALVLTVSLRDPGARERDARAATAAARTSLEQLLSYGWQTLDAQAQRNAGLLTGSFKKEYAVTMASTIAPVAQKQKVTVQARSYEAGVMGQTPDTVTVQVFLDQAKTAQGQEQPSVDQNRVIATMRKVDGRWLVEQLSAY